MEAIDEYSNKEEFSTDPDPQITEEKLSLEEIPNRSNSDQQVESPSKIGSPVKEIILENQITVPLIENTPGEESISGGDSFRTNLGLLGQTNPKITQVESNHLNLIQSSSNMWNMEIYDNGK
jgi:hypothetical protein